MLSLNYSFSKLSASKAAMCLVLTEDRIDEDRIKAELRKINYKCAVTEIGAPLREFKEKVMKSVVAAALNCNIVENIDTEIHALVHATLEAAQGILIASLANPSIMVKVGIVCDDKWLAVAMYGSAALHVKTNHERSGLGVMHLPKKFETKEEFEKFCRRDKV